MCCTSKANIKNKKKKNQKIPINVHTFNDITAIQMTGENWNTNCWPKKTVFSWKSYTVCCQPRKSLSSLFPWPGNKQNWGPRVALVIADDTPHTLRATHSTAGPDSGCGISGEHTQLDLTLTLASLGDLRSRVTNHMSAEPILDSDDDFYWEWIYTNCIHC